MLVIRSDQIKVLEDSQLKRFEDSMVVHVRTYFPNHFRIGGEPTIRNIIRHGIQSAEQYGFRSERDVCLYITVMFMLGTHFDKDSLFPWTTAILTARPGDNPSVRAGRLADTALEYEVQIAGPENRHMNRAFLSLRRDYPHLLAGTLPAAFAPAIHDRLYTLFPQKYDALGPPLMEHMVQDGMRAAEHYGIRSTQGQLLYIVMMYFLGTRFDIEPFVPWAQATLQDASLPDEETRIARLHKEGGTFLEKWFEKPTS
jgi:hypothetical protein